MISGEGVTVPETLLDIATVGSGIPEHASLKHHLLGPSLTKAGQDSVDQQKVRVAMLLYAPILMLGANGISRSQRLYIMPRKALNSSTMKKIETSP